MVDRQICESTFIKNGMFLLMLFITLSCQRVEKEFSYNFSSDDVFLFEKTLEGYNTSVNIQGKIKNDVTLSIKGMNSKYFTPRVYLLKAGEIDTLISIDNFYQEKMIMSINGNRNRGDNLNFYLYY